MLPEKSEKESGEKKREKSMKIGRHACMEDGKSRREAKDGETKSRPRNPLCISLQETPSTVHGAAEFPAG